MTKKERKALEEEQVRLRRRLAEIRERLAPLPADSAALTYLRSVSGPVKGALVAERTGQTQSSAVRDLSREVKLGRVERVGVGVYQAVAV